MLSVSVLRGHHDKYLDFEGGHLMPGSNYDNCPHAGHMIDFRIAM